MTHTPSLDAQQHANRYALLAWRRYQTQRWIDPCSFLGEFVGVSNGAFLVQTNHGTSQRAPPLLSPLFKIYPQVPSSNGSDFSVKPSACFAWVPVSPGDPGYQANLPLIRAPPSRTHNVRIVPDASLKAPGSGGGGGARGGGGSGGRVQRRGPRYIPSARVREVREVVGNRRGGGGSIWWVDPGGGDLTPVFTTQCHQGLIQRWDWAGPGPGP